ncbi:type II CAAX endopeptidase family protein [Sphingomonas sp.]|uniref:CPBP family intramembrane glutamic endopeptidase n=1 Tax=Sphingomonas sp. TaxID=28214 RepID=UPI00286E0161|nr:type II CAAX endopeptidase family protein [Sphingomonas sp.]
MNETAQPAPAWWKRLIDFPLVAMIIAIGLFIAANAAAILAGKYLPPMDQPFELIAKATLSLTFVWAVYKYAIVRLGARPRDDLPLNGAAKGVGAGVLIGVVLFSAVVGVAALADVYNIIGEGGTSQLISALVAMAILPGFLEELLVRGILFRWIEEFAGSWAALAVTSLLFGFGHIVNPNATVFSSFAIALEAGLLLGGAYMLTRNLWLAIGIHAAWNFTQGFVFDVPVSGIDQNGLVEAHLSGPELLSGGAFGLEASVIAMVLATSAGVAMIVMAIKRDGAVRPWWVQRRLEKAVGVDVDRDADLGAPLEPAEPVADDVLDIEHPRRMD